MWGKVIAFAVLTGFAAFCIKMVIVFDVNKRVYNHSPGPCREVKGIKHGSEDIAMVESLGLAFITSGLYYMSERAPEVKGNIFLYDFNDNKYEAVPLAINGKLDRKSFRPHGITHWLEKDGSLRLFVISHAPPKFEHTVEVFDYDKQKKTLNHVRTIKDEKFFRPNDLTAVGPDSFILANDGTAQTELTNMLEILSGYRGGSIVYYDGKATSPNGIILARDGQHLLVSHINDEIIAVYKLAKDFKSMSLVSQTHTMTSQDNFYIDQEGAVWTGAHPILKDALGHLKNCDDLSQHGPSQILRIKFSPDWSSADIVEVFADDGKRLSASSIAVHFKNQLLLGTVCRQMLHCDVAHPDVLH